MGTNKLWDTAKKACQEVSFREHLIQVRRSKPQAECREPVPIGIDISIWMNACQAVANSNGLYEYTPTPTLETLFYKLAFLLQYPIHPLIVFDGPDRPVIKRGKAVITSSTWLEKELKELLPMFGFSWHQAAGEAEAELAQMNRVGHIDSVITTDSDTLVFQAPCIIRTDLNTSHDGDRITRYELDDLRAHIEVGLTEGGLLLFALLLGGDYHDGLDHCGAGTALGLARAGYGDSLLKSVRELTPEQLNDFLVGWRNDIQRELMSNSRRYLPQRNIQAAAMINASFPNLEALNLYLYPNVSALPYQPLSLHREPSIPRLAQFCHHKLGWTANKIIAWSRNKLWRGVFSQMLYSALLVYDGSPIPLLRTPSLGIQLASLSWGRKRKTTSLRFVDFKFASTTLDELTGAPMEGRDSAEVAVSVAKDFVPGFLHPPAKGPKEKSEKKKSRKRSRKGKGQPNATEKEASHHQPEPIPSSSRVQVAVDPSPASRLPIPRLELRDLSQSPSLPPPVSLACPTSSSITKKRSPAKKKPAEDDAVIVVSGPSPVSRSKAEAPSQSQPIDLTAISDDERSDSERERADLEEMEVERLLVMEGRQDKGNTDHIEFVDMRVNGQEVISLL